jgi:hypothetical protein
MGFAEVGLATGIRFARSKGDGVGKCATTGSDMHRATASIIEGRKIVQPSVCVPIPVVSHMPHGQMQQPCSQGVFDAAKVRLTRSSTRSAKH